MLPQNLKANLGRYVVVKTETDKPYVHIEEHRHKYPPGQLKKGVIVNGGYVKVPPGQLKKGVIINEGYVKVPPGQLKKHRNK